MWRVHLWKGLLQWLGSGNSSSIQMGQKDKMVAFEKDSEQAYNA